MLFDVAEVDRHYHSEKRTLVGQSRIIMYVMGRCDCDACLEGEVEKMVYC